MPRIITNEDGATTVIIDPPENEEETPQGVWNLTAQAIHDAARAEALAEVAAESVEEALEEIETANQESEERWTTFQAQVTQLQNDMGLIREQLSELMERCNPPLNMEESMSLTEAEIAEEEAAEIAEEPPIAETNTSETGSETSGSIRTEAEERSGEENTEVITEITARKVKMY